MNRVLSALLLLLALAATACTVEPIRFPARVYVPAGELTGAELAALERAAAEWNTALAAPVFTITQADPGDDCHTIRVVKAVPKSGAPASNTLTSCRATIYVHPRAGELVPAQYHYAMLAHELGHVLLGPGHSDDPRDLMAEVFPNALIEAPSLISDANVEDALRIDSVRALVDGP